MTNGKLNVLVTIDGTAKFFDGIVAAGIEAALADIREAYAGEVVLIQYRAA